MSYAEAYPRAAWLRQTIHKPPEITDVATRQEALAILTAMARDGKVTPAVELAKLLKGTEDAAGRDDPLANVDQIFRTKANGEAEAVSPTPRRSPPHRPASRRSRSLGTP
jgi:hypothetical protein